MTIIDLNVLKTVYASWLNVRETGRVTHNDLTALKSAIDMGIAPPAVMEGMEPFKRKGTDAVPGTWPHYADAAAQANDEGDEFAMPVLSERKKRAQRIISLIGKKADLDDAQRSWLEGAEKTFNFCNKRIKFFDEFLCVKILNAIDAAGHKEADRIREEERRSQEAARRSREEERRARDAADPVGAKAREELRASAAKSPVLPPVLARPVGGLPRPVAHAATPKKAEPAAKAAPAPKKEAAPKQTTAHVETTLGQDMLATFEKNVESNKEQGLGETEARLAASEDILNRILTGNYNEIARKLLKNELHRAVTVAMKPLSTSDKDAAAQARLWMSKTETKLRAAPKRSQKKRDAREDRPAERRTEADVAARPVEEDVVAEMLRQTLVPKVPTTTEAPISATAQAPTA